MLFIYLFTFTVILSSILASAGVLKKGLEISFCLITLLSAFRYDFGPDYINYMKSYNYLCNHYSLATFMSDDAYSKEPGWSVLCLLTSPIGFSGLIILISFFTYYVYYRFIKDNVPVQYQWLSVTCYVINPYWFWIHMSMIRQALAVVVFVFAFKYICQKRIILSLILILTSASVHRSAVILFPFLFWGFIPINRGKQIAIIVIILFLSLFTLTPIIIELVLSHFLDNPIVSDYMYSYGTRVGAGAEAFGLGGTIYLIPLVVMTYYLWKSKNAGYAKYLVLIACVYFFILPLSLINGFFGRLAYYFHIFFIVAIPISFRFTSRPIAIPLFVIYFSMVLRSYFLFFSDPSWTSFSSYKTILFN